MSVQCAVCIAQVRTIEISVVTSIVCIRSLSSSLLIWLKLFSCCDILSVTYDKNK